MKAFGRTAALLLAFVMLIASAATAFAVFDKTTLAGGVFQLNVVHSVTIPALQNRQYTVWTSAVCFAAGSGEDGELFLVTDASLSQPDRMLQTLSQQFIDILTAEGLEAYPSELGGIIQVEQTNYYLVYEGSLVELSPLSQTVSNNILVLKPNNAIEAPSFSYAYADACEKNDTVHTFALSGSEVDGLILADQDAYITNWSFSTQAGEIMVPATVEDGNISCTMSDIPMTRSSQGSALFDDDGNVIGLNIWMENSNQLISLTSSAIMAILDQAGIEYTVNEKTRQEFPIKEAIIYLAIALALIVVLIVILAILHSRKKKLEEEDISQLELEASRARAEYARQQNNAASQRASSRQATQHVQASRPVQQPLVAPAVQYTNVMLTILDGPMKGLNTQIENRSVLGRDPESCDIVFSAEAIAVSRRHCAISFNRNTGRVLLEDLSSSNGTYFPSGTRIIPGRLYALRSGDRFYLGQPENLVEIRMS